MLQSTNKENEVADVVKLVPMNIELSRKNQQVACTGPAIITLATFSLSTRSACLHVVWKKELPIQTTWGN